MAKRRPPFTGFAVGKYKSKPVNVAGRSFASKLEKDLFVELKIREAAGEISNINCQVSVYLTTARIRYIPDYSATLDGETIYYEAKGFETPVWRIKRRLWMHYGPGILLVYKRQGIGLVLQETIIPKG